MANLRKLICVCVCAGLAGVSIQQAAAATAAPTTEELRAQIAQMQAQLQQQQQAMQQMQAKLDSLEARPSVAPAPAPAEPLISEASAPPNPESHIVKPPSALAGETPEPEGYVRLGNTGNLLKIDVVAQLDMMFDDKFMPYQDLFIPAAIPVEGQPFFDSDFRTNLSAKQSIFRMDYRRDTPYGIVKVVYKNNFFGFDGPEMDYNLQYMYGELEAPNYSLLIGYYLSGFTDISVFPNTLDYEGPNSFTFKYTPQIRYTPTIYTSGDGKLTLPMALEEPKADIAVIGDYEPYAHVPDITIGLRWETPDWHIQWSNLFRDLSVQSALDDRTATTTAYATQITVAAGVFGDDSVQAWGSWGAGYANFLQDVSGLGLDAAFTTDLDLEAIDAEGYGVGYTHSWNEKMSTSASYGLIKINPDDDMIIDPFLPEKTQYFSINWAWQFSERGMFGFEYLWGENNLLNNLSGDAQRIQATVRYDLNP